MKQAILITAYKDFEQLVLLIDQFDNDFNFYIHIDKKSSIRNTNDRIIALTKGWENAQILSSNETLIASNIPKKDSVIKFTNKNINQIKNPSHAYQVFLALDTTFYYIDKKDIIFVEKKNKFYPVGEKKESTKPGFDWIFIKGNDSYGVDLKGRLWAFSYEGTFHVVGQSVKLN